MTDATDRDAVLVGNEVLAAALAAHTKLLTDSAAKIEALNEKIDALNYDMDQLKAKLPDQ